MPRPRGDRQQRIHVGAQAVEVHRDDRPGPRRDRARRTAAGIEVVGRGIDVDEPRRRAEAGDAAGGREERVGAGDDFVAGRRCRAPSARRAARRCPTTRRSRRPTPSASASSRSSASTSGPRMKRWLSQTRVIGGQQLVAERPVLRLRSSSGTAVDRRSPEAASNDDLRRTPERRGRCACRPALPGGLA